MPTMTLTERNTWVRRCVADAGIDPILDQHALRSLIERSFEHYPVTDEEDRLATITALLADIGGYGPLQPYLNDPQVEEIYLNEPGKVFVARNGMSELTPVILTAEDVRDLVERMLHHSGRRLDLSIPFVDAMLPTGERLHVVIPPVAGRHWSVNIRKHLVHSDSVVDLARKGMLGADAAGFLMKAMRAGVTIVVSGATQAGKTTFVRALAAEIPPRRRVITCEEVFELNLTNRDCVAMQTRNVNVEGVGAVTLRDLVRESLRMRPERIVVGEVRGAEALDMLLAINAGIPGMSTLHANSAEEALHKLCVLPLLAGGNIGAEFVVPTVAASVDLVIHITRDPDGFRHLDQIRYVTGRCEGGRVESMPLWVWEDGALKSVMPMPSELAQRLAQAPSDVDRDSVGGGR